MTSSKRGSRGDDEVFDLLALVWEVDHELRRLSKQMEARLGVTGPQRLAVRVLGRRPNLTAGELAQALRLHPSTLTGILRRLEDAGLVKRGRDANDKRRARFTLTAKGRGIDVDTAGTVESAMRVALKQSDDVAAGRAFLVELTRALQRTRTTKR